MALLHDDISINTLVGKGSFIKGNLRVNGFIRIDGDIDGNLETDGNVIIGETARVRGNLSAKSVIIGGIIFGNITTKENVKLLTTSAVIGNIISKKTVIENNAFFQGHCISIPEEQKFKIQSEKFLQNQSIISKVNI